MTEVIDRVQADQALKAKHRAMWAWGDYPAVATEVIPDLGPALVLGQGFASGNSEIHDLDLSAAGSVQEVDVVGLEIAMNDAVAVGSGQRITNLPQQGH